MDDLRLSPLNIPGVDENKRPLVIAGPCSAETEEQVMNTARQLAGRGCKIFRAGVWKPRTKPGGFEGMGEAALPWLQRVKAETGMLTATEVAMPKHVEAALNAGIRATLGKLTRFEVREVSADKPDPACTHTAKWTAAIRGEAKPTDDPRRRDLVLTCDLRLTFADARSKTQAGSYTFTESVSLPQTLGADGTVASGADLANQGTLTVPLRQLGSKLGVRIAQALSESAPCGGDILACDDVDEMTMEGGSFQGVYDGLQMLVYATIDGLPLPLGYADAKPGSTRTNLTLWKLNEADPMAQAVLDALDDDPDAFAKYKLRAIAVGDPLPPIWRRQVAQPSEAAR